MNIKAMIFDKNNNLLNEFVVIKYGMRINFELLEKYCSNAYQYEDIKYTIDLLKDHGFNYLKNGICTKGIDIFRSYEFAKLKYIIEFIEF